MSGGQSAIASLATENADAQSRQNAATMTGKGSRTRSDDKGVTGDGTAMFAVRMAIFPFCPAHRLAHCHLEIK
jgi:hypothetical protein